MYPSPAEKAVIHDAEELMTTTMARYDPSHDQYHGKEMNIFLAKKFLKLLFSSTR